MDNFGLLVDELEVTLTECTSSNILSGQPNIVSYWVVWDSRTIEGNHVTSPENDPRTFGFAGIRGSFPATRQLISINSRFCSGLSRSRPVRSRGESTLSETEKEHFRGSCDEVLLPSISRDPTAKASAVAQSTGWPLLTLSARAWQCVLSKRWCTVCSTSVTELWR